MHNKTPTEQRPKRLSFSLASRCNICCQEEDTAGHLLFTCNQGNSLWRWIFKAASIQAPSSFSASSIWLALARRNDASGIRYMAAIFISVIHTLWKARNEVTFDDHMTPLHQIKLQLQVSLSISLQKISKPYCSPQIRSMLHFLKVPER